LIEKDRERREKQRQRQREKSGLIMVDPAPPWIVDPDNLGLKGKKVGVRGYGSATQLS
jgi:hypothetical protein